MSTDWRRWIDALPARVRAIVGSRRLERDLDDELTFHVAMQTHANMRDGMNEADAHRRARLTFGGVSQSKEQCRDARPLRWTHDLMQDVRYGLRSLRRTPGFTAISLIVLALGIGANTALFSVVSAVVLRPLPFPDADRLVRLWTAQPRNVVVRSGTALPDYRAWREANRSFEDIGAFFGASYNLTGTDHPEVLLTTRITASLWSVLKSQPLHGRVFSADNEEWGSHRVAVISERLWRRRFNADPQLVGRAIELNGQPHTVVAVMPTSFQFPGPLQELWVPLAFMDGDAMTTRGNRSLELLGRLRPATTLAQAEAELRSIADAVSRDVPENVGLGVAIAEWQETIVGQIRPALFLLLGAVGVVMLIACANMANLLFARTTARGHELTVRATLGADRWRLVRQLLTENLLLACGGAVLGLGMAYGLIRVLPTLGPIGIPRLREVTLDGPVVGFTVALTLLTALAFGLWPARLAGRAGVNSRLKESARTVIGGAVRLRVRSLLVTAEVALSLVLLVGAGLLILSLQRVIRVDPGFQPEHLFTASVTLPPIRYRNADRVSAFIQQTIERIAVLPGVVKAGGTTTFPLAPSEWTKYFSVEGRPAPPSLSDVPLVRYRQVTADYLQAMGASLRRGRLLGPDDVPGKSPVAVINETIARRFWPDADPIGQLISMNPPQSLVPEQIRRSGNRPPSLIVVGVIADFRQNGLERETNPEVFVPVAQITGDFLPTFFLVARTAGDPLALTTSIQSALNQLDRNIPLANVRTMDSRLSDSLAQRRFVMLLLGAFALLAVVLALVGLYGVLSYAVNQRRQELGVRAALGATAGDLLRLVLGDGMRMTGVGIVIGLVLAGALSRLLTTQLFQVNAVEPVVYAAVSALLVVVAGVACGLPARRATRVDPATALRCE